MSDFRESRIKSNLAPSVRLSRSNCLPIEQSRESQTFKNTLIVMKRLLCLLLAFSCLNAFAAKPKHKYVRISTELGECIVMLYNETPLHSANFLKLSKAHFYDGTLFHRVIKNFMIQGGDPDSRHPKADRKSVV